MSEDRFILLDPGASRTDAERNRLRVLNVAHELFAERGDGPTRVGRWRRF